MKIDNVIIDKATELLSQQGSIIDIYWEGEGEFGHIYLYSYNDGRLELDSEHMGKEFVKQVFNKLIENAEMEE
jgi:hypothetical protein